jgi:hypothetical protein
MADQNIQTKSQLLAEIDKSWVALNFSLARLSEAQMTTVQDGHGWTVKDHITHMAAWESSVVFFLQGKPRSAGLGVAQSLFETRPIDEINEAIQQLHKDLSLAGATSQLQTTHRQLISLLNPLTDADLNQPLGTDHPELTDSDQRRVIDIIRDNTSGHFSEHLGWIEALVSPVE